MKYTAQTGLWIYKASIRDAGTLTCIAVLGKIFKIRLGNRLFFWWGQANVFYGSCCDCIENSVKCVYLVQTTLNMKINFQQKGVSTYDQENYLFKI